MRRLAFALGLLGLVLAALVTGSAVALTPVPRVGPPVPVTGGASAITSTTAAIEGTVNPGGQTTTYSFDYGTATSYGLQTATQTAAAGYVDVPASASLTGLTPATTYHYRVTATNAAATVLGADRTFTTATAPTAVTGPASAVAATSATLAGTVNPEGAPSTVYSFQYGTTTSYSLQTPMLSAGSGTTDLAVAGPITGLMPGMTYHYRVLAANASVTVPGADQTFVTPGAAAGSSLAVRTNQTGGDTDLATTLTIGSDPAGTPVGQASIIAEALPPQFANQLASFGICAASSFNNLQGPTAANCSDRSSILGAASLVTRGQTDAALTSDQGYIVRTAGNGIVFWWHTPAVGATPQGFGQVPGLVSQETGPYGPVVSYDFSSLPAGARVQQLAIDYQRNTVTGKAPFAAATCVAGSRQFQARIGYQGGVAPEQPTATVPCGVAPQPSKLQLSRATIYGRVIDILAPISRRASGSVSLELYAAGQRSKWTAPINSVDGRVRNRHLLPASQANNGGTGILTIRYAGNAVTRPQVVRLRAANIPAFLGASRPTLVGGHLRTHGRVSSRAHGVVRVQLEYYSAGQTTTLERYAAISNGGWNLDVALTPAQQTAISMRRGTVESYILFTGYFRRRMRGEMIAYQVLGSA